MATYLPSRHPQLRDRSTVCSAHKIYQISLPAVYLLSSILGDGMQILKLVFLLGTRVFSFLFSIILFQGTVLRTVNEQTVNMWFK